METKKAVIYCRVSTKEQAEEGNSLITQEKTCREYARKQGFEVVAVFIEHGESAKTADRTELKKLMGFCAIKKNDIRAVIAYKIDRISRNTDDYSQIRILLRRYGVEIKSTSEYFEDTPAGRFMENIIANVAQFDNDVRAERSIGGMRDAVREGRYVWMAPLGYSNVRIDGKATIAPNHLAPLLRKAFEKVAKNLQPVEEIRKNLITEGLVNANGVPVSKSHFYTLIRNELYTGWVNKFGERHKGAFEPIISEGLFQYVQFILTQKKDHNRKYIVQSPDFPLRRFFIHPSGQLLTGCWSKGRKKKYPYYLYHKRGVIIRKEVLEKSFVDLLNQFSLSETHFEKLLLLVKKQLASRVHNKNLKVDQLQRQITHLKEKQAILIEKNIEGVISNELCKERIGILEKQLYETQLAISDLSTGSTINYPALFKIIKGVLIKPGEVWERAGFAEKIKLQWFYFPHGIEFDGLQSRTTKICSLFKLKEIISPLQSGIVPHRNNKSNTTIQQISLPGDFKTDVLSQYMETDESFWKTLEEEIKYLESLQETCEAGKLPL